MGTPTARYTGVNVTVTFGSTTVTPDYTEFSGEFAVKTETRVAGNDGDESFNVLYRTGKGTLKFYDTGSGSGATLLAALLPGTTGNLFVYPQGIGTGKPYFSFPALIENMKTPFQFDKNVIYEVAWLKNGAFINAIGSTQ